MTGNTALMLRRLRPETKRVLLSALRASLNEGRTTKWR